MEAKKRYDWGFIDVRFAVEKPVSNWHTYQILKAHAAIQEAMALLDLNPCGACSGTGSRLSERSKTGEVPCANCGGSGAMKP